MKKKHKRMLDFLERRVEELVLDSSDHADQLKRDDSAIQVCDTLLTGIERRLSRIEKRFEASDELLRKLDPEVGNHAIGLENLETKMDKLPNRLETLESKLDSLWGDVLDLRGKVARLIPPKGE